MPEKAVVLNREKAQHLNELVTVEWAERQQY